jgi:phosphoribosylanthranilate isomerase
VTAIKFCGLTRADDAEAAIALGVDALGLNFWPGSPRRCGVGEARAIVERVAGRARVVAVVVDASLPEIEALRGATDIEWVQLHGREGDELVRACLPSAYKAVKDEASARAAPGDEVLLDADVPGKLGGTGERADWDAAARVARARKTWLAGGLAAGNVAEAIARVRPYGVDVASGIESAPGIKDRAKMEAFVRAVREG